MSVQTFVDQSFNSLRVMHEKRIVQKPITIEVKQCKTERKVLHAGNTAWLENKILLTLRYMR